MTAEEIVAALTAAEDLLLAANFPFKYQSGSVTTFLQGNDRVTVDEGTNIHLIIWPVVATLILVILLLALFARRYRYDYPAFLHARALRKGFLVCFVSSTVGFSSPPRISPSLFPSASVAPRTRIRRYN